MKNFLDQPIEELQNIGPYYQQRLKKMRIKTVRDFLRHFPLRYDDFSSLKNIAEVKVGETCSVLGRIEKIKTRKAFRKKLFITEAILKDQTGEVRLVWFGPHYLSKSMAEKSVVIISGKVSEKLGKLSFSSPAHEVVSRDDDNTDSEDVDFSKLKHTAGLIPVYPETQGMTSRGMRFFLKPLVERAKNQPDFLPESVVKKAGLLDFKTAIQEVHFPGSFRAAEEAKKRFAFEEIFLTQFLLLEARAENASFKSPSIPIDIEFVKRILGKLSFELTQTQKQALWEIIKDLNRDYPMSRLLNGDVGSGKTVVSLVSLALAVKHGFQAVFMAPTEILSRQHFETASKLLKNFGIEIALLVSKQAVIFSSDLEGELTKTSLKKIVQSGQPILVIGTQAVLQKDVDFPKLGLVVIDEQHRFGVKQRQQLLLQPDSVPHFLSMSATPIPRTLALGLWGDLDISIISELPQNRKRIETRMIDSDHRQEVYDFVRQRVQRGEQAFIICPRVDQADPDYEKFLLSDAKAVKQELERLRRDIFPDLRLGLLHGRLRSAEKEKAMAEFSQNKTNILVSTSVIEVGIDVPNATVMIIEGADRFGLAQLHQFRGRVGRGEKQSYCFLLSETGSEAAQERLKSFADSFDGFSLAEQDLKLRGPGQFFGIRQSGIPDLATNALKDLKLVIMARKLAEACLEKIDKLPLLKNELESFRKRVHLE